MGAPSISYTDLNKYFSLLTPVEKASVLTIIRSMVESKTPEAVSLEQYNQQIDEAVNRVRKGDFTTQEDLDKEKEGW